MTYVLLIYWWSSFTIQTHSIDDLTKVQCEALRKQQIADSANIPGRTHAVCLKRGEK